MHGEQKVRHAEYLSIDNTHSEQPDIFARRDYYSRITLLNIPQPKLRNIRVIFPLFQNCACCKKKLLNKHISLSLV